MRNDIHCTKYDAWSEAFAFAFDRYKAGLMGLHCGVQAERVFPPGSSKTCHGLASSEMRPPRVRMTSIARQNSITFNVRITTIATGRFYREARGQRQSSLTGDGIAGSLRQLSTSMIECLT